MFDPAGDLAVAFEGPDSIEVRRGSQVGRGFLDDGQQSEAVGFGGTVARTDRVLWLRRSEFPDLAAEEELEIMEAGALKTVRVLDPLPVDSVFLAVRIGRGA